MEAILEQAMRPYIRDGWMIQHQDEQRVQLFKKAQKSKAGCLLLGIPYLLWPKRDEVVTLELVDGKVQTTRTKVK